MALGRKPWLRSIALVATVLAVPLLDPLAHDAVFVLLAVWAVRGPRQTIEALTLTWLATGLNPGVYQRGEYLLLRWLVIFAAFAATLVRSSQSGFRPSVAWRWVLVFCIGASGLAVISSYSLHVSLLKLLALLATATAVLFSYDALRHRADYWRTWFLSFFAVVLLASIPLTFLRAGYTRNAVGFQGLLNHPQLYGVFLACFLPWIAALLFTKRIRGVFPWVLLVLGVASLVASQARTAVLASVLGMVLALLWGAIRSPTKDRVATLGVLAAASALFVAIMVLGVDPGGVISRAQSFMVGKRGTTSGLGEALQTSRGRLIDRPITGFQEHPLTGIGFGLASDPEEFRIRTGALAVPVSATVEKGFFLTALLEEVGITGFLLGILMIVALLAPVFRKDVPLPCICLALAVMLTNFGESTFFSPGGGVLPWLLIGAAGAMAAGGSSHRGPGASRLRARRNLK